MKIQANIVQGDDVDLVFNIKTKANTAVNLTGAASITFQLGRLDDQDALIEKTVGDGVTVNDAAAGQITVALADTDTEELLPGTYYFDVLVVDSAGKKSTMRDFDDEPGELTVLDKVAD